VVAAPEAAGRVSVYVRPAPNPALFRAFADLSPDRKRILEFANRHGDLFGTTKVVPAGRSGPGPVEPRNGTWLSDWREQIALAQRLVGLWDLLQGEDREGLARHIQWRKGFLNQPEVLFDSHPGAGEEGGPALGFQREREVIAPHDRFQVGDPVGPAWTYLQRHIGFALCHTDEQLHAQMEWDEKAARPVLQLTARTLASAVWLQFADAVSNNRTHSRCRECSAWFEVAPDLARTNRRFCSNGCRSKAYRERQDRARRLFTARKTFKQIAEELDSDVATVKKWITGSKE
jgi:hypothetical protein